MESRPVMWLIAQYWPKEQEFYFCGQYIGFPVNDLEEIDCEKIEQPEYLVNWVSKTRT
jgi:hypothetical protein